MVDEITKEQALKLVDTINADRKSLMQEKQQLIKFLEDKIKEYRLFATVVKALQEVLDFVNKGDEE